jgi:diguanylate cyclase (GGDEF)-like protein
MTRENLLRLKRLLGDINNDELSFLIDNLLSEVDKEEYRNIIDSVTGLYNRSILDTIKACRIIIIFDIGDVNGMRKKYGMAGTNSILKRIGKILYGNFRMTDTVCRFNDSQFLVVFEDLELDAVLDRITLIRRIINSDIQLPELYDIKAGIAINNSPFDDVNRVVNKAIGALAKAKETDLDCYIEGYKKESNMSLEKKNKRTSK